MKITLLTVGKTDRDWVRQGLDIYISRLKHYIPFTLTEIPELGMKAMAFSEHGSVFSWYSKKCAIEAAGMKYIHAEEFYVTKERILIYRGTDKDKRRRTDTQEYQTV